MKNLVLFLAFSFLFSSLVWAADNNTFQQAASFQAQVTMPIQISDPGTVQIGDIAPGTTKLMNNEAYRMQFNISGAQNWNFAVSGTIDQAGNNGDCNLVCDWQYWDNNSWNTYNAFPWHLKLDGNGNYSVACFPKSIWADAAAVQGPRSFTVTLTATYEDM